MNRSSGWMPGWIGAPLLLWGWQTGFGGVAIVLAVLLEGSRWVRFDWRLEPRLVHRWADFSALLMLLSLMYNYKINNIESPVIGLLRHLPMVLLPLMVVTAYGSEGRCRLDTLLVSLRKIKDGSGLRQISLALPYAGICLAAAGCSRFSNPWYFVLATLWVAWVLWSVRSRRYGVLIWCCCLLISAGGGWALHTGLHHLQSWLTLAAPEWLSDWMQVPDRRRSAIGDVGQLKLSDRIVFRVRQVTLPWQYPLLLRDASYSYYVDNGWQAALSRYVPLNPVGQSWSVDGSAGSAANIVQVYKSFSADVGWLPLPLGTVRVDDLSARQVERDQYGTVKASGVAGVGSYTARYELGESLEPPPGKWDLHIPKEEQAVLARVVEELGLGSRPPMEVLTGLSRFFQERFKYSTWLTREDEGQTALSDFLLKTRSGHCEYFATATTLLLRQAGIPSRYAVGYSVQEEQGGQNMFIVRARHAHAWSVAYVDGAWRNVDNTPPDWSAVEEQGAAFWVPLLDLWSDGLFFLQQYFEHGVSVAWVPELSWLALLFGLILVRKHLLRLRRVRRHAVVSVEGEQPPFARIEHYLAGIGKGRHPGETLQSWTERIQDPQLVLLMQMYYPLKYDPCQFNNTIDFNNLLHDLDIWLFDIKKNYKK
ncbi:MAG: transglutaminase-like domain-containing protein [Magnetococcus sp. YQC-5]